ncbi:YhgN family NAAT transporter [bacterium]|nr:YhgN family NAAT transporter [bacterium]
MDIYTPTITLFLVMDPLGNIPIFLSILAKVDPARRRKVLARELLIALVIMLAFLFAGRYVLQMLSLRPESISISGGIILFLIALRMVFPGRYHESDFGGDGEPFLVPLAIPLIAGPSTLAMLSLFVQKEPQHIVFWATVLVAAWLASSAILLGATRFYKIFGKNGLSALESLMGMLLIAMSVQMFLDGIAVYLRTTTVIE